MFTLFIMTTLFLGVGGGPLICLIGLNVKMKCFDPGRWTCLTQWDLLELLRSSPVNFPYQLCASPTSRSLSLCSCALFLLTKALRKETGISIRAIAIEFFLWTCPIFLKHDCSLPIVHMIIFVLQEIQPFQNSGIKWVEIVNFIFEIFGKLPALWQNDNLISQKISC